MTLHLTKSQIDALPFDFEQAVRDFIAAKEAHRSTCDPAPAAADLIVEAAVKRIQYPVEAERPDDFVADYEIEDDTPPPEPPAPPPTLEQRKQTLIAESRLQEQNEIGALMPAGKRRLLEIEFQRAVSVMEADRSSDQQATIEQYRALSERMGEIAYAAALREAAIEDIAE
jgi:hypothetical protein